VASAYCRAEHGKSAYLPAQGAVLEVAQALVQGAQVRALGGLAASMCCILSV
jgi:hypothetical protein